MHQFFMILILATSIKYNFSQSPEKCNCQCSQPGPNICKELAEMKKQIVSALTGLDLLQRNVNTNSDAIGSLNHKISVLFSSEPGDKMQKDVYEVKSPVNTLETLFYNEETFENKVEEEINGTIESTNKTTVQHLQTSGYKIDSMHENETKEFRNRLEKMEEKLNTQDFKELSTDVKTLNVAFTDLNNTITRIFKSVNTGMQWIKNKTSELDYLACRVNVTEDKLTNLSKEVQIQKKDYLLTAQSDTTGAPNLCQNATIDAVTRTKSGNTYFFKGDVYWKIVNDKIASGYPRKISDDWGDLEGNLDAAVTLPNGNTYFFKDQRFWSFTNKNMHPDYPKPMDFLFKGIPTKLDAAFVWGVNNKLYFVKGHRYWKFEMERNPQIESWYPMLLSEWKGLPYNVDAAFKWENNATYFFRGSLYYKYDDEIDTVDSSYYPRPTAKQWFGC